MPQPIRSRRDPRLVDWIDRSRGDGDLVVLDGIKPVREALRSGIEAETLLFGSDLRAEARTELAAIAGRRLPAIEIASRLERHVSDTVTPRDAILLVPRPAPHPYPPSPAGGPLVVLDGLQDPGNLGAIVRVAEAAAACGVATTPGSARAFAPRAVRASAGSALRVPIWEGIETLPTGWNAVALAADARTALADSPPAAPAVIVLGSEGRGLSARFDQVERRSLPMAGELASLAVLSAASVALWIVTGFRPPVLRSPASRT